MAEWIHLDAYGEVVGRFEGTAEELLAHLLATVPDVQVAPPRDGEVYVHSLVASISTPVVHARTPWSTQRWIPRPQRPTPRPHSSWLLRR